ncbi:MAG: DUF523 and DUF1722 domain-containing protein [Campylobacterales bacterium]|nr:DUF523 and DUF1722 domain-containing protein [Campylobacterales bacterium]
MNIAISSCLLGNVVRYDGKDQSSEYVLKKLSSFVNFIPFCPENRAFGTPREPISLNLINEKVEVITNFSKKNLTKELNETIEEELLTFPTKINGIILKSKSPSCGLESKLLVEGKNIGKIEGVFASRLIKKYENVPIIQECSLGNIFLKEEFLIHLFALKRFENLKLVGSKFKDLYKFNEANSLFFNMKDKVKAKKLNEILNKKLSFEEMFDSYEKHYKILISQNIDKKMAVLLMKEIVSTFIKDRKIVLKKLIKDYKNGLIPLIVLLELLKDGLNHELMSQTIFNLYPKKLL